MMPEAKPLYERLLKRREWLATLPEIKQFGSGDEVETTAYVKIGAAVIDCQELYDLGVPQDIIDFLEVARTEYPACVAHSIDELEKL